MEEEIRETAWNLCKQYDAQKRRREKVILAGFVSIELEKKFGWRTENLYRTEAQEEVRIFCEKYGYRG